MLTVNIPDQAKPLIERLGAMPENEFEAVRTALNRATPSLRFEKFAEEVKSIAKGVFEIGELAEVITSLSRSPRDPSVTVDELAISVASEVLKRKGQQPDPTILVSRLIALLSIQSLKLYSRASNVQMQYEDIFISSRIISDIRTVFEPDGTKPLGAMIVHNLKITARHGDHHHHDKFFALDNVDLDMLQQCIERAREKTKSLELIIEQSNLTYFPSK